MKRIVPFSLSGLVLFTLVLALATGAGYSQEHSQTTKSISIEHTPEGKIKLKVTTEENGDTKTFEKEYSSKEEMENDPEYKEFFGEDLQMHWMDDQEDFFSFDFGDHQGMMFDFHQGFDFDLDRDMDHFKYFFRGDDDPGDNFYFRFDGDESLQEMRDRLKELHPDIDVMEFNEEMEKTLEELQDKLKDINSNLQNFDFDLHLSPKDHTNKNLIIIDRKKLTIKDLGSDDKDLGKISKSTGTLNLDALSYFPNPNDGRFTLRFKVTEEGPLAVKILDMAGKEVFTQSYNSFGGVFKQDIDLTDHEKGIFLLEIAQGKKKLVKKLILE